MGLLWSSCEPSRIAVGRKSTEHLRIDTGRPRTPPPGSPWQWGRGRSEGPSTTVGWH